MKVIFFFALIVLLESCSGPTDRFSGFDHLKGTWTCLQDGKTFTESWTISGDRMYGRGYLVQEKDTLFGEKLIVEMVNGRLVYIADVPGQNPVLFTCIKNDGNSWVFENSDHDFPGRILYENKGDRLHVVLEGKEGEREIKEEWVFKREQQ